MYRKFVKYGLLTWVMGEFMNNFVIWIPWVSSSGNFLFAMGFYVITLSITYFIFKILIKNRFPRYMYSYIFFMGVVIGLFLNEWIIVGNDINNPNVDNIFSQLTMISFHGAMYTVPVLVIFRPEFISLVKKFSFWMLFVIWTWIVFRFTWLHAFVMPWCIILGYMIWYNFYFYKIIQTVRNIKKDQKKLNKKREE